MAELSKAKKRLARAKREGSYQRAQRKNLMKASMQMAKNLNEQNEQLQHLLAASNAMVRLVLSEKGPVYVTLNDLEAAEYDQRPVRIVEVEDPDAPLGMLEVYFEEQKEEEEVVSVGA